ncbi:beta-1,3-galactosyl-O-glycosyl-glycoprotein beta-1,6-N-acetylglucosaminyltransferase 3-like [Mercenaria mercenaria]|uniref:beta-1,3-galactosyl-O-glycosyl-glycoprotein beta-1,6-N-acetylglucosaminyltransferase 3-like n=1 Tax=Mercenaria mercenaria TaxID=6596 RepID=UPI00234F298E|nr:beta-1,3-galactosyl-O-glycosyl-glycoprotein beta-1,6-N-acetylglucosaminyltransferase 3-like [Mercenaria mercenaria]
MDWLLKKTADFALENAMTSDGNKNPSFPGQRHLAEYEYPEMLHTTTRSLNLENSSQNCSLAKSYECPVQCKLGHATNMKVRKHYVSEKTNHARPDCNLDEVVKSCGHFKELYGYNEVPVTHEERNFPLAFSIKMHSHPEQAETILRTIYRSHNMYCIHVDLQADGNTFEVMNNIGKCFNNIIIIQERERMIHSSYAHVMSDIKCMRALSNSSIPWKYYINLSGEEFPLKTNLEMVAILQFFQGMNDVETYDHPVGENWKIENKFARYGNSLAQDTPKPEFKYKMKFSKGNPFGLFSRAFIDFVFKDDVAQDILNWFNDTYAPDENIWATIVTLPWAPGGYPVEVRQMISTYVSRAMIFTGDTPRCHGRFLRGYCQFGCGDIPWLQSRPEFFASKLDLGNNRNVLNCLFDWYRIKTLNPELVNINWAFYNRLPHMKYHRKHQLLLKSSSRVAEIKKEWLMKSTKQL